MELMQSIVDLCNKNNDVKQKNAKEKGSDKRNIKLRKDNQSGKKLDIKEFCDTHGIEISHEKPLDNGTCYVLSRCPWNDEHSVDKGAYIIQFSNGKIVAGCHHDSCRDENWGTLLKKYKVKQYQIEPSRGMSSGDTKGMSAADILMDDIMQSGHEFFHDNKETAYVLSLSQMDIGSIWGYWTTDTERCYSKCIMPIITRH